MPRVAVVAADRRVRDSLSSLFAATGRIEVIGAVGDQRAALILVGTRSPDAVVLDPRLVGPGAGQLIRDLRRRAPATRILIVEWDGHGETVLLQGADGILDANAVPAALVASLTAAGPTATPGD